ncbi:MAG: c-type cytochrome [Nitrospiraceae bacterium]|nr:c-type cytochrome [Nitrospiraceae bacterium]
MMTSGGMMGRGGMKEMMQRMMPDMLPLGITPEDLPLPDSPGAKLLVRYCTQCHNLPSPAMHTAEQWPGVTSRMFSRMSMMSAMIGMMNVELPSSEEQQAIVSYLKTNAMKSLSPSELPAPGSQGAVLFKETCSQCHPLPDPKLHTADEWPKVVDRMQSNMRSMGKKIITDNEKTEVVGYLTRYGRSK